MPHFSAAGISYTGMLTTDVLPYPCSMARPSHEVLSCEPPVRNNITNCFMGLPCHKVLSGEALGAEQHPSILHGLALP